MNKNHNIVMALAFAALLGMSGTASAAVVQPYSVPGGMVVTYIVDGPSPSLSNKIGDADIVDVRSLAPGLWEADVECFEALPFVCTGLLHS